MKLVSAESRRRTGRFMADFLPIEMAERLEGPAVVHRGDEVIDSEDREAFDVQKAAHPR